MNLGLDHILLMLGAGHTTHDQVMRALDLLGEKVISKFKEPVTSTKTEGPAPNDKRLGIPNALVSQPRV
jgi:hypothetical protein